MRLGPAQHVWCAKHQECLGHGDVRVLAGGLRPTGGRAGALPGMEVLLVEMFGEEKYLLAWIRTVVPHAARHQRRRCVPGTCERLS